MIGIFSDYLNLIDQKILMSFEDNLLQLKKHDFIGITYIIIDKKNDKSEIKKTITKFLHEVKIRFFNHLNTIEYNKSIKEKIRFEIIETDNSLLDSLKLNHKYSELWLYRDQNFKYGFKTIENNLEYEYQIMTALDSNISWQITNSFLKK
ncbi:MAG: hypothetical protein IPK03_03460 [Bacteroidetes bacterium]|nr:hypothetical protein [Bacteroidota bacterium]